MSRDHRKTIAIDGRVGFVTGVCISAAWRGDPARLLEPWRDTGIEIRGPAVAELEEAFAEVWRACGGAALAKKDMTAPGDIARAGDVAVRVIAGTPSAAGVFRLDQLIASAARDYLWLTDAYFVGLSPYVQALCAAARDGVDVRLLVPGASDIAALQPLSRAGYRPLLAAGVRVFEWNGTMLHAKTAVADGLWARVGSTNLNFASWIQNWELDVAIEDRGFAAEMAAMYEEDLRRATEIVLTRRNRVRKIGGGQPRGTRAPRGLGQRRARRRRRDFRRQRDGGGAHEPSPAGTGGIGIAGEACGVRARDVGHRLPVAADAGDPARDHRGLARALDARQGVGIAAAAHAGTACTSGGAGRRQGRKHGWRPRQARCYNLKMRP